MVYNNCMRRQTKIRIIVLFGLIIYYLLSQYVSNVVAYAYAGIVLGITFVKYVNLKIKMYKISQKKAYNISNAFLSNKNTLTNGYCVVKYIRDEKIIVVDNPKSKNRTIMRAFTVDNTNCENVNVCWENICSMFDEFTYLDTLFSFIDRASGILNLIFLNPAGEDFEIDDIEEFISKPISYKKEAPQPQNNEKKSKIKVTPKGQPIIVDFDDIKQGSKEKTNFEDRKKARNLKDLERGKKIYVNYSDAQTISILPGINIVKAKKIVSYRDIHGLFKSKEDFIAISNVKEHFKKILPDMISIDKFNPSEDDDIPESYGRIVDYQ